MYASAMGRTASSSSKASASTSEASRAFPETPPASGGSEGGVSARPLLTEPGAIAPNPFVASAGAKAAKPMSKSGSTGWRWWVPAVIRTLGGLGFLGTATVAAWGIYLAEIRYTRQNNNTNPNDFALDNRQFAIFQGMMGVYYGLFGIFGFLAELRTSCLLTTVLRPFGFLHSWIGRGCFLIFIGTILSVIPWDPDRSYVSLIPAGFDIGVGSLEILCAIFLGKDNKRFLAPKSKKGTEVRSWPTDSSAAASNASASASSSAATPRFDGDKTTAPLPESPNKAAPGGAFANPFKGESGAAAPLIPGSGGAATTVSTTVTATGEVVTKNPFGK